MPLPFILGAAALAAAGYGAKKGYDGYQTKSDADEMYKKSEEAYKWVKSEFDKADALCNQRLEKLGNHQLQIGKEFSEFEKIAKDLLSKLNQNSSNRKLQLNIPKHKLDNIERLSFSAISYLGSVVGAGALGAGAAYAVYGGVLALGAASTGTSIATLSGAAAYNATMAAIGGGSLAAGGYGMAGGAMVLGATVVAPILAVAGWAYNAHAEKALDNARKHRDEACDAIEKMQLCIEQFRTLGSYAVRMDSAIKKIHTIFGEYFDKLKSMNAIVKNYPAVLENMEDDVFGVIENGYKVAAILADLVSTPLFKVKKDGAGNIVMKDDLPQMETDKNGLQAINKEELDSKISRTDSDINNFVQDNK